MKRQTVDISGFGGGYEAECQRMLWRGVAYLNEVNPPTDMWKGAKEYRNIVGVMSIEGADLKALEDVVVPPGSDCTGAMHQAVMGHLRYIHAHGTDAWLTELRQHRREPGAFYTVDTKTGEPVVGGPA